VNTSTKQIPFSKLLTTRESFIIISVWLSITAFVIFAYQWSEFITSWIVTIPACWFMYHVSFRWLFPKALTFRFSFLLYAFYIGLYCIAVFLVDTLLLSMIYYEDDFFISVAGITFFTLLFIAIVQWFVFKRFARKNEELFVLKKELGQTEANVDMLRSQINPHFLFNALNTLYGLAIHEKAERTSEAIEKLGSMMRFMLQENEQEKISLNRDLEYLHTYIALQR
jgi:sensor histidine kinase YesM